MTAGTGVSRRPGRVLAAALAGALLAGVATGVLPVLSALPQAAAAQTPVSCGSAVALQNGGFELPVLPANSYAQLPDSQVPGWLTTATDHLVELWRAPFSSVPAATGAQFAELNATQASTLYQEVTTTPGQTLRWELQHRGRQGSDVMAVYIGAAGSTLTAANRSGPLITDGTAWGTHSGVYTVPAGQTRTRFAFQAVTSTGPNASYGNFLDSIAFGTAPCLVTTTTVATPTGTSTADVGDLLTYTVTTVNDGGNPAGETVLADALPADVEFVPGSIRAVTGTASSSRTDAAADDAGEYDAATRTVRVRIGTGAGTTTGGTISPGDARSVSYQVRVAASASGLTLRDDASVSYRDALTNSVQTSTSDEAVTAVRLAADISVPTLDQSPGVLVAGLPTSWTATLANAGPSAEPAPVLTVAVPAGLTGVTATATGGATCTVDGSTVTCPGPALASGASRTVTVTGTVPAATAPATRYTVLATASGSAFDRRPADNSSSRTDAVTGLADVSVRLAADRATGVAGQEVTYTATVANAGPSTARDLRLADPLPPGATLVSATPPAGGSCSPPASTGTVGCSLGDLAPGAEAVVLLTVRLDPGGQGDLDDAVSVASSTPDSDVDDLTAAVRGPGTQLADLSIALSLSASTLLPGGGAQTVTIVLRNDGLSDATNVVVRPALPPGVRVTGTDHPTCVPGNCVIARISAGEQLTVIGTFEVDADAPVGTALASGTVVSSVPDVDQADQSASVSALVQLSADLAVTASLDSADDPGTPVVAGGATAGATVVTNNGPTRAEGLVMRFAAVAGQPVPQITLTGPTGVAAGCAYQGTVDNGMAVSGGAVVCTLEQLKPGETWELASYGTLPANYSGTTFTRTRSVTATSPDPQPANGSADAVVPVVRRADLQLQKTTSTPTVVQTGAVEYVVQITNGGPSDAAAVLVKEEPQPGVLITSATPSSGEYSDATGGWRIPYLAVGASALLTVTGTAESDQDVLNRVVLAGSDTPHPDLAGAVDEVSVHVLPAARTLTVQPLAAVTPAAHQTAARVNDAVDLGYLVRNDGNVRMSGIRVADTLQSAGVTCPLDALLPGEQMTCSGNATHRVSQADFDAAAALTSSATVTGRAPDSVSDISFGPVGTTVPMAPGAPGLALALVPQWDDADGDGALDAGETIHWTAVVTDTGDLGLADVTVSVPGVPALSCADTVLAPGASTSCTSAAYVLTPADVAAGQRGATATVEAVDQRNGTTVTGPSASAAVPAAPLPALALSLHGVVTPPGHQGAARLGDAITWRHVVTNVGNVQVTGLAVDGPGGVPVTCASTVLDPGAATTCTSDTDSVVAEPDLLSGWVTGRATVTGVPAAGAAQVRSAQAQDDVATAGAARVLGITAHATTPGGAPARPGTSISYGYDVRNDGDLTMRLVAVTDDLVGAAQCAQDVLAPGATTTCAGGGSYRVTQADFDAGDPIVDLAWVSGIPNGSGTPLSFGPASSPVPVAAPAPALTVTAAADWVDAGLPDVLDQGETIDWSALVVNTGDVTLLGIDVQTPSGVGPVTCPVTVLGPGERMRCTLPHYTVTNADEAAAEKQLDVTATGAGLRGGPVAATDGVSTPTDLDPAIGLTVAPAVVGSIPPSVGDRVRWRYTVTNEGNVPVQGLTVADEDGQLVTCPAVVLRPGESATCVATVVQTVTEDDVRAGALSAAGTAAAEPTAGPAAGIEVSSPRAENVLLTAALVRGVEITATALGAASAVVGDRIGYRWVVRNPGNVTMDAVAVADSAGGTPSCAATSLAPGASTTCTDGAEHEVTQAEFDAGLPVGLTATASGLPLGESSRLTTAPQAAPTALAAAHPALTAAKAADWSDDGDGVLEAGEVVDWTVTVTNSGDVTVADLLVVDPLVYVGCPASTLAPGQDVACTSDTYAVTAADETAEERTNTASAVAEEPRAGTAVTSNVAAAAAVGAPPPIPELTVAVDGVVAPAARQQAAELGDTVQWRYTVTNSGGVPVSGISVTDAADGTVACAAGTLAPASTVVCDGTAPHVVGEADVLAGELAAEATAAGTAVGGSTIASPAALGSVDTTPARAGLALAMALEDTTAAERSGSPLAGDAVRTRYRVTNSGNVTLGQVGVTDAAFGSVTCAQPVLTPGASTDCWSLGLHVVDPADVTSGWVLSSATATGEPALGSGLGPVSAALTTRVPLAGSVPGTTIADAAPRAALRRLPDTGLDLAGLLALAALSIAGGVVLQLTGRRRGARCPS